MPVGKPFTSSLLAIVNPYTWWTNLSWVDSRVPLTIT
jgi:hypothetical protein